MGRYNRRIAVLHIGYQSVRTENKFFIEWEFINMKKTILKGLSIISAAAIMGAAVIAPADIYSADNALLTVSAENITGDGDGDGAVTVSDATIALSVYAKKAAGLSVSEYTDAQLQAVDVNFDGEINLTDASAILEYYAQKAAGLDPSWGSGSGSEYDSGIMRSNMTAMDFVQEMGVGINLGNTFDAYWEDLNKTTSGAQTIGNNTPVKYETCWGAVETTEAAIAGIADAGFDTIRIPVYWGNMMNNDGKYEINDDYINRVQEVVDWSRKNGLYVVINVHHYDMFLVKNHSKDEVLKASEIIWTQIAEHFKGYSDYLIFEGYNEALGTYQDGVSLSESEVYDYVNDMNQVFVDAVRSAGGNNDERILIASGYWTNIDNTTKSSFVMPSDPAENRMMVSVHYIDNTCYWTNAVGNDYWQNYSKSQCELLKNAFISKNIPVFVGECTASYTSDHIASNATIKDSSQCLSTILNMAVDYDLIPVLWDVSNGFYSKTNCKINKSSNSAVISEIAAKIANK